jgi:hypothetical protein
VAVHGIPLGSGECTTKQDFFAKAFPDSEIAENFSSSHTKTTAIINRKLMF